MRLSNSPLATEVVSAARAGPITGVSPPRNAGTETLQSSGFSEFAGFDDQSNFDGDADFAVPVDSPASTPSGPPVMRPDRTTTTRLEPESG
jgi:hypothetical protein